MADRFIYNSVKSSTGSNESTRLKVVTDTVTGESEIVVTHSLSYRFKLNDNNMKRANELYEKLISDGFKIDIKQLAKYIETGQIK